MTFAIAAPAPMCRSAVISFCGQYRYVLRRTWQDVTAPAAVFVLLNPSTADHRDDDPTVRRLITFARDWGYGRMVLVNLFAWRSTDPAALRRAHDPVGPDNDIMIAEEIRAEKIRGGGAVVCAWGKHGSLNGRDRAALTIIRNAGAQPSYLRLNRDGTPAHPLYLPGDLRPTPWMENADG